MNLRTSDPRKLALSLAVALLAACGAIPEGAQGSEPGEENHASAYSPLQRVAPPWPGGAVPVCYRMPSSFTTTERQNALAFWHRTRGAVEDGWQRVANINFYNWGECGSGLGGWLVVDFAASGGSWSGLGYPGSSGSTFMMLNINDRREPVVALHEFGHALGFSHEFDRDDWTGSCMKCTTTADCGGSDKVCLPSGYCGQPYPAKDKVTPTDLDSIMAATYCSNFANNTGRLSSWDILGAQRVYGRRHHGSIVGLGGRCLNISGGLANWGQEIIAWNCMAASNDTFRAIAAASGSRLLQATIGTSPLCLNVAGGAVSSTSATPLISWGCDTSAGNELVELTGITVRTMGNMCVVATSTTAGARLEIRQCGSSPSLERWDVRDATLRLNNTHLCVTVPSASNPLGTRPTLQTCGLGSNRQDFGFVNGEIRKGSLCWNVLGGFPTVGSGVGLWDGCGNGLDNEYFYITGTMRMMGQCIDILGGASYNGAKVGAYPCHSGANQQWDYHWR